MSRSGARHSSEELAGKSPTKPSVLTSPRPTLSSPSDDSSVAGAIQSKTVTMLKTLTLSMWKAWTQGQMKTPKIVVLTIVLLSEPCYSLDKLPVVRHFILFTLHESFALSPRAGIFGLPEPNVESPVTVICHLLRVTGSDPPFAI